MPREHAQVNMGIWQDPDFRRLPPPAQHLYLTLWTHPGLSYCGVVDWRPGRIAALSEGWTAGDVRTAADCLRARYFIVVDEDTEECLIRSWVRWDGLMKQPRMAVSYANAHGAVGSNLLRSVIVDELKKLRKRDSGLVGFGKAQVMAMLDLPSVSAKDLPPVSDPFAPGLTPGFGVRFGPTEAMGLEEAAPQVSGLVSVSPTPAPTPAPLLLNSTASRATLTLATPEPEQQDTAQTLIAGWIDGCRARPPGNVVGQVAKHVGAMLAEGIPAEVLKRALPVWQTKALHPSTLPSVVHEIQNEALPEKQWFEQ